MPRIQKVKTKIQIGSLVIDMQKLGTIPTVCCFRKECYHNCNEVSHIKRACKSQSGTSHLPQKVRFLEESDKSTCSTQTTEYVLFAVSSGTPPTTVDLTLDSQRVSMKLDKESAVSLMSEEMHRQLWSDQEFQPSTTNLHTYSGES